MKLDHKDYINLLLFIAVVILLFVVTIKMGTEATQCILNPLQFGVKQLQDSNTERVLCSCDILGGGYGKGIWFDENGTWEKDLFG